MNGRVGLTVALLALAFGAAPAPSALAAKNAKFQATLSGTQHESAAVPADPGAAVLGTAPEVAAADVAVVHSKVSGLAEIDGVGCGVAASVTVSLPATATAITVRRPRVGATDHNSRLTEAAVTGTSVRFTAVGQGTFLCDPEQSSVPPDQRAWYGAYEYVIAFHEHVPVRYWPGRLTGPLVKPAARPRTIRVDDIRKVVRTQWRSFGGPVAVGYGRLRCKTRGCVGRGDRFKVVLDRPSRCGDVFPTVFYGRVTLYTTRAYPSRYYPIRRGAVYSGASPECGKTEVTPV